MIALTAAWSLQNVERQRQAPTSPVPRWTRGHRRRPSQPPNLYKGYKGTVEARCPARTTTSTATARRATLHVVTEESREDLIEELLATSGKYPGLAEFLDQQRDAERNSFAPKQEKSVRRRRVTSRAEPAQL